MRKPEPVLPELQQRTFIHGWPFAPLGTFFVIPFRTNSRIRFVAA
jgi:hypothetical protein